MLLACRSTTDQIHTRFIAAWIERHSYGLLLGISKRGSFQVHQLCTSRHFPLKAHSGIHTASCKAGIPNLPGLLFSMYNEDYGLIPVSQGGAVGIERVKALR